MSDFTGVRSGCGACMFCVSLARLVCVQHTGNKFCAGNDAAVYGYGYCPLSQSYEQEQPSNPVNLVSFKAPCCRVNALQFNAGPLNVVFDPGSAQGTLRWICGGLRCLCAGDARLCLAYVHCICSHMTPCIRHA